MRGWECGRGLPPLFSFPQAAPLSSPPPFSLPPPFLPPLPPSFSISPTLFLSRLSLSPLPLSPSRSLLPLPTSLALKENCFALLREECRHDVKSGALCVVHLKCFLIYITLIPSPLPPPHQPFQISLEICVKRGGENICLKSEGARQGRLYHALPCVRLLQSL